MIYEYKHDVHCISLWFKAAETNLEDRPTLSEYKAVAISSVGAFLRLTSQLLQGHYLHKWNHTQSCKFFVGHTLAAV